MNFVVFHKDQTSYYPYYCLNFYLNFNALDFFKKFMNDYNYNYSKLKMNNHKHFLMLYHRLFILDFHLEKSFIE